MQPLKIAAVQMNCAMGDRETNLARIIAHCERAADAGAAIVCFPELSITGSLYEAAYELSETIPGPSSEALLPVARRRNLVIIAGTCEMGPDGTVYNSLVLVFPDGRVSRFRKLYIPPGEYPHFRAGSDVPVFEIPGCKFGVSICADLNFAELYKLLAVKGAEVIFNANGGGHRAGHDEPLADEVMQRRLAEDRPRYAYFMRYFSDTNAVYMFMCNQVGYSTHPTWRGKWFPGVVLVADPRGHIIAESQDALNDEMVVVQLDPDRFAQARSAWAFALHKRRRDILEELARLS